MTQNNSRLSGIFPTKTSKAIFSVFLIALLTLSAFFVLYTPKADVSASGYTSLGLSVSPEGSTFKLGVNESKTFTASSLNGTSPFVYTWSLNPSGNFTLSINGELKEVSNASALQVVGSELTLSYPVATEEYVSVSVFVKDSNGYSGQTLIPFVVADPYTSPGYKFDASTATASYIITTDGLGWYRAIKGSTGEVSWSSTNLTSTTNNALWGLTVGRTSSETVLLKGNFTTDGILLPDNYTNLVIDGAITGTKAQLALIANRNYASGVNNHINILGTGNAYLDCNSLVTNGVYLNNSVAQFTPSHGSAIDSSVKDFTIVGALGYGISAYRQFLLTIDHNTVAFGAGGIYMFGSYDCYIETPIVTSCYGRNLNLVSCGIMHVSDSYFGGSTDVTIGSQVELQNTYGSLFENTIIDNAGDDFSSSGINKAAIHIWAGGNYNTNNIFTGTQITEPNTNNQITAIQLDDTRGNIFNGLHIGSKSSVAGAMGNSFKYGIVETGTANNNTINGGHIDNIDPQVLLMNNGFESSDFTGYDFQTGSPTVQSAFVHSGTYAMNCTADATYTTWALGTPQSTLFFNAYAYMSNVAVANILIQLKGSGGQTITCGVSSSQWYITNEAGAYSSNLGAVTAGWHNIQLERKVGAGNGVIALWVDGVQLYSISTATITTNTQYLQFGGVWEASSTIITMDDAKASASYIMPVSTICNLIGSQSQIVNVIGAPTVGYIAQPISGTTLVPYGGNSFTWTSGTTYTNLGNVKTLYVSGGTVTAIVVDGQTLYTTATTCSITLRPQDTFSVTFSAMPTIKVIGQ